MTGLRERIQTALPSSLAERIRWLFAVFAVLVAGLAVLEALLSGQPPWPDQVVAVSALTVAAIWVWNQYRRGGLSPGWDVVPPTALFATGTAMDGPGIVFGLLFVLLFARSLYGSARQLTVAATGLVVAYEAADAVAIGLDAVFEVSTLVLVLAAAFSAGIMRLLGDVVARHERESRRGAVLSRMASALQRAEGHEEVFAIGAAAGLELLDDLPDAVVAWWRGDPHTLRVEGRGGALPVDVPPEIAVELLPDQVAQRLLAGDPFAMSERDTVATQKTMGMAPPWLTSCLMVPIGRQEQFRGVLTAAGTSPLPVELLPALERLSADVGLALELADRTLLLRQVVENSSDAILLVDAALRVDFASPAILPILGYPPDEIHGRSLADLLETEEEVGHLLRTAMVASQHRDPRVLPMRHHDGGLRHIELASTALPGRPGWVVNLRDVTQRIRAEQELEDSRRRFRLLAESVSEGLYRVTLEPELRYQYVNPAMERISGFRADEFIDDPGLVLRQVHPDDLSVVEHSRSDPDAVPWPVEIRWRHPDSGWRWVSIHETVIHDPVTGVPMSAMGIISDVTARREEEQALRQALEHERRVADELRRVDVMRSTFLQAVSHELRTPLTVILGFSQTLNREDGRLAEHKRRMLLERLQVQAERLDRLLSDLLDVDRLANGVVEPVRHRVDVTQLCRRVVGQTASTTHPISCIGEAVVADLDPAKVERIVANLVANAVKHTDAGTPIRVEVLTDGDEVTIAVEDRGPGVPVELRETIFQPFVQGPASSSAPEPGTGIGLSLVARFAELHGGHASVEEADGGGARFLVRLPVVPDGSEHRERRETDPAAHLIEPASGP